MASVTLVVGDEDLLVERAVSQSVRALSAGPGADLGPAVLDVAGAELTLDGLQELISPSLFAETRILVIRSAQDIDKAIATALVAAVQDPELEFGLIAAHAGGVKGKAVLEALKPVAGDVITVQKLKSARDREQFVIEEAKRAGGRLDRDAAADLVASIGSDIRELATASAQLVSDVGRDIGVEEVALYYRGRAESSGFAIADRAVEGDAAAAIETLRWAFATGLDPILVSSSLAANLRLIAQVAGAGGGSPDAIAGRLGLPPWKVRRALTWRRKWRPDALATAVQAVAAADADVKGAGDDPAYAVERAVLAVAAAANAPA